MKPAGGDPVPKEYRRPAPDVGRGAGVLLGALPARPPSSPDPGHPDTERGRIVRGRR